MLRVDGRRIETQQASNLLLKIEAQNRLAGNWLLNGSQCLKNKALLALRDSLSLGGVQFQQAFTDQLQLTRQKAIPTGMTLNLAARCLGKASRLEQ